MNPLAIMLCAVRLASADPDAPPKPVDAPEVTPPAEAGLQYEAMLRAEYLTGQPILVPIRVWNGGSASLEAPDIERRPWLIAFTFDQGNGQIERRRTTPPASDVGQMVQLSPRSQRRTLLEIPATGSLKPAEYRLQVTLDPDTIPRPLATGTIRVASPSPASADMVRSISAASRSSDTTVWLHKATDGYDLYLSPLSTNGRRIPAQWITHLEEQVNPVLSEASGGETGERHVMWSTGKRSFGWIALEGSGVEPEARSVEMPWPEIELVGRPATDATGNLHVPVWIPAPKGSSGEVRVVTILDRGAVSYRRAAKFEARPVSVSTTVDDSGAVQLLVSTKDAVDLYTVRQSGSVHAELPIPGRRIARAEPGSQYIDVRFGLRSTTADRKGGLSILATTRTDVTLQSTWLGMRGTVLDERPPSPVPEGGSLEGLVTSTTGSIGYLYKTASRQAHFIEANQTIQFEESLHGDWGLVRRDDGSAALIRTAKGSIFTVRSLRPEG